MRLGKREELHDMARRLAVASSYFVVTNLYYRNDRDFGSTSESESTMRRMFALMDLPQRIQRNVTTQAMLTFVDAHADGRTAIGGYRASGPFVVWAAATPRSLCVALHRFTERTWPPCALTSDRTAPPFSCESYFACAEIDKWAPPRVTPQAKM
jgi:carboxymethylenebutenolidase